MSLPCRLGWLTFLLTPPPVASLRPTLAIAPLIHRPTLPVLPRVSSKATDISGPQSALKARREELLKELKEVETFIEGSRDMPLPRNSPTGVGVGVGSRTSTYDPSFGFLSKSAGSYVYTDNTSRLDGRAGPPSNVVDLAMKNFVRELGEILLAVGCESGSSTL